MATIDRLNGDIRRVLKIVPGVGSARAERQSCGRYGLNIPDLQSRLPEKYAATPGLGLGFFASAIIDPHFSERRRLGRLLSVLAQRPQMLGVCVDEDTALVIERGQGGEIVGQGAVTLIDSRRMRSNFDDIASSER